MLSPDFFDVSRFPIRAFKGTAIEPLIWNSSKLAGSLSIRWIPREITLDGEFFGRIKCPEKFGREISMGFALTTGFLYQKAGSQLECAHEEQQHGRRPGDRAVVWANLAIDLAEE